MTGAALVEALRPDYGKRWLDAEGTPELLFTENETNYEKALSARRKFSLRKGCFNDIIVSGARGGRESGRGRDKGAAHYPAEIPPGGSVTIRLRLTDTPAPSSARPFRFGI